MPRRAAPSHVVGAMREQHGRARCVAAAKRFVEVGGAGWIVDADEIESVRAADRNVLVVENVKTEDWSERARATRRRRRDIRDCP